MRIAFHAPMKPPGDPVPSGDRRLARLFVEALERTGATVDLATTFRSYDRGDPVRQTRLEALGARLAERLLRRYARVPALRPDAWFTYHLYHKATDHLGPAVSAALGIPYLVAEASFAPKQAGGLFDIGHRAAARAIAAADRIYTLNPVDAECLAPLVRSPDVLLPLAPFIDTAPFAVAPAERTTAKRHLAATYGFDPAKPIILTVAMMRADQKRASYAVLADAVSRLSGRDDVQLLVVGDGPASADVQAMFASLSARIVFADRLEGEALRAAYAGADLFAWPSVKEAFGIAFIEASASGLAVVAGRSGGIDAIVEDGVTGIVVPAGNAQALATGLARLLNDPATANAMGVAAADHALNCNDIRGVSRVLGKDVINFISRRNSGLLA